MATHRIPERLDRATVRTSFHPDTPGVACRFRRELGGLGSAESSILTIHPQPRLLRPSRLTCPPRDHQPSEGLASRVGFSSEAAACMRPTAGTKSSCAVRVVHWPPGAHFSSTPGAEPPPLKSANGDAPPQPYMSWPWASAGLDWGLALRTAPAGTTTPSACCVHWPPGAYWVWSPTLPLPRNGAKGDQ